MSTQDTTLPPPDTIRIELVTAIHMLASCFENSLYAFGKDAEARKIAEGDIAHAMGIAAKYNQNGAAIAAQAPKAEPKLDDFDQPIVYDTGEIDLIAHALTGDEGEDDGVTVLNGLVKYLGIVHPGKTMTQVLIETEDARAAVKESLTVEAQQQPWVWNPASLQWAKVLAPGHWHVGALYAFGAEAPDPLVETAEDSSVHQQAQGVPAGFEQVALPGGSYGWRYAVAESAQLLLDIDKNGGLSSGGESYPNTLNVHDMAQRLDALLKLAAAPQAEPLTPAPAQRVEWVGISLSERLDNLMHAAKWDADEVPHLKANLIRDIERCAQAPAVAAEPQPEREPLAEGEINEACSGIYEIEHGVHYDDAIARAVEQACANKWGIKLAGIGTKGGTAA